MKTTRLFLTLVVPGLLFAQAKSAVPLPGPGQVSLPLDEYNRLVERAGKPPKQPEAAPLPYALKQAELKLRVDGELVLGTMQLDGEVFSKGATKVPLTSGMALLDARQQGRVLPLQQEGGVRTAVLPGAGEFSIALDIGLPLAIETGRASFSLPAPPAGTVRLALSIPGDHTNVKLNPGLITARRSEAGRTAIEATLVAGQSATLSWTTREIAAPVAAHEVRFLSDVKTLVSISESDMRIAALADITVVQGEPAQFEVSIPQGYEITGATGASLESSETQSGSLLLKVSSATQRSHQFLISMERPIEGSTAEVPFLTFKGAQRETGELMVEGAGAMELTAKESGGVKRMDIRESSPYLHSLARFPLQAAFRYHRQPTEVQGLLLSWVRFPDSNVLSAAADEAIVTTLVTYEGKSLSEVKLLLKNQSQPFLKVDLPAGATILSADVNGEKVKPVEGPDGNRVPLLRPGFRPKGAYTVSFVFLHSGTPFAKKGGSQLALPKMDIPIALLQWEVFLPQQYTVKNFDGDTVAADLMSTAPQPVVDAEELFGPAEINSVNGIGYGIGGGSGAGIGGGAYSVGQLKQGHLNGALNQLAPGQLGGSIMDPSGAAISNARVTVVHSGTGASVTTYTDANGRWAVSNLPSGAVQVTSDAPGFQRTIQNASFDTNLPSELDLSMSVGAVAETITVTADAAKIQTEMTSVKNDRNRRGDRDANKKPAPPPASPVNAPSSNVANLQRLVTGVLPIKVDVPRAGNSYRFARTLILNEETHLAFDYKVR